MIASSSRSSAAASSSVNSRFMPYRWGGSPMRRARLAAAGEPSDMGQKLKSGLRPTPRTKRCVSPSLILKRHRLRRVHRWQFVHDCPEPGVGFGLKAAMPGRCDEILDSAIAGTSQGPHEGFCLVEMAYPVVTPMHDI